MTAFSLLISLVFVVCTNAQLGWGVTGHALVADIAQELLKSNSQNSIAYLLSAVNGSMSAVASWADQVRSKKEYAWSSPLHFIDTPDWACNYNHSRDCNTAQYNDFCVASAITNYTTQLTQPLSFFQLNEALKFLIHFIGDIHQPLHTGFTTDRGGNSFKGTFEGTVSNLHEVWDSSILSKRMKDDFKGDYSQYLHYLIKQIQTTWNSSYPQWITCTPPFRNADCSDQWAVEGIDLACNYAYVQADGKTHITDHFILGDDYYQRNYPIVELQLAKGGSRLASVLNSLYSSLIF